MTTEALAFFAMALSAALFLAILGCLEVGRQYGLRARQTTGDAARPSITVVSAVVQTTVSLLIGFVFSGAASRFDSRRNLTIDETSAISTAWQRVDALAPEPQPAIRDGMRRYTDALLSAYRARSVDDEERQRAQVTRVQDELWSLAMAACLAPSGEKARMLLLPALNEMYDAVDKERLARFIHPPRVIWVMLGVAILAASLLTGFNLANEARRPWLQMSAIAATVSIAIYVIIEIEYPRLGLVRMNPIDRTLVELRATMR